MDKMIKKIVKNSWVGDLNPRWNGGRSDYPLHGYLKRQRLEALRAAKGKCQICTGAKASFVHHIDGQRDNHELNNLIAVCHDCHMALHAERRNKTSKFIREFGVGLRDIAEALGLSYHTAYSWTKDKDKREKMLTLYRQKARMQGGGR